LCFTKHQVEYSVFAKKNVAKGLIFIKSNYSIFAAQSIVKLNIKMKHLTFIKLFVVLIPVFLFISCNNEDPDPVVDTTLTIVVKDLGGNFVEGAEVMLFDNGNDWSNKKNALFVVKNTDSQGKVSFPKIEAIEYWISVEKDNLNNWFTTKTTGGAIAEKKITELAITIR